MIICVSDAYCTSENCKRELEYGANLNKKMIVVKLDSKLILAGKGSVSLILGSKLYIEFTGDEGKLFKEIGKTPFLRSKVLSHSTNLTPYVIFVRRASYHFKA